MNIFQKIKNYDRVVEEFNNETKQLENEIEKLIKENNRLNHNLTTVKERYNNYLKYSQEFAQSLLSNEKVLNNKIKSLQGAKGGLVTENNKLKAKVIELTEQLKDAMSDKYLVKRIPSGKLPKGQPMKIKDSSKLSKIIKDLKVDQ